MRTNQRAGNVSTLGRGACLIIAIVSILVVGVMIEPATAGDDYWERQQYQQTLQNEQRQAEQRNREAVQEYSRPTHPTWNQQQEQRLAEPPVRNFTLQQWQPDGTMRQSNCYASKTMTSCF